MKDIIEVKQEFVREFMSCGLYDTPEGRFEIDEVTEIPDGLGGYIFEVLAYSDEPSEALDAEIRDCIPNPFVYLGWSVSTVVCILSDRPELLVG